MAQPCPSMAASTNFSAMRRNLRLPDPSSSLTASRTASAKSFSVSRPRGLPDCPDFHVIASNPNSLFSHAFNKSFLSCEFAQKFVPIWNDVQDTLHLLLWPLANQLIALDRLLAVRRMHWPPALGQALD